MPALTGLGVATRLQTIAFLAAIGRIPLGTAVAVEFLGPMTVGAARTRSTRALAWPALALAGVALLTQPWHGHVNPAGLGLAGLAAIGWAAWILLTQRIGGRFTVIQGLSLTAPAANSTSSASPGSTVAIAAALTGRFHARPESSAEATTTPATPEI